MTIKMGSGLWLLNLVAITLIVVIIFIPSEPLRIILGIPFLIFIPGYALLMTLSPRREGMGGIERVALSFGLSIAVVPLIGLILNYTWWGITLESMLYSTASFIFVMSIIAESRRKRLQKQERFGIELQLRLPGWGGSAWNKLLSVVLVIAILGALGMLGYAIATPKVGEEFTEFYILGLEGEVADYPEELVVGEERKVVVGIINREHKDIYYRVEIRSAETLIGELGPVMLHDGQELEQGVNFTPVSVGENQRVEFLLFKEGEGVPYRLLHLWIDVRK